MLTLSLLFLLNAYFIPANLVNFPLFFLCPWWPACSPWCCSGSAAARCRRVRSGWPEGGRPHCDLCTSPMGHREWRMPCEGKKKITAWPGEAATLWPLHQPQGHQDGGCHVQVKQGHSVAERRPAMLWPLQQPPRVTRRMMCEGQTRSKHGREEAATLWPLKQSPRVTRMEDDVCGSNKVTAWPRGGGHAVTSATVPKGLEDGGWCVRVKQGRYR